MIDLFKKIVRKIQHIRHRFVGLIKRIIRFVLAFLVRRISAYPRVAGLAIRILNKFPHLKALVRRVTQSRVIVSGASAAEIPLTHYAQQLEDDLLHAIAQKKGR